MGLLSRLSWTGHGGEGKRATRRAVGASGEAPGLRGEGRGEEADDDDDDAAVIVSRGEGTCTANSL